MLHMYVYQGAWMPILHLDVSVRALFFRVGAAETQKSKIYVQVFVVSLRVCIQWGLERTKPTPAGRKTVSMVSS